MIDIHIHGLDGIDTNTGQVDELITLSKMLARVGVTAFLPTIYPSSIEKMRVQMSLIKEAMYLQDSAPSQGAKILGVNLEGPFLNPTKAGALDSSFFIQATEYNLKALLEGFEDIVRIVTIAPEIEGALGLIKTIRNEGIIVSLGHSDATFNEAEAAFNAGATGITHLFNAMRGIHHREPGLAGFGLIHKHIFVEVIADPFHLHLNTLEMVFRLKPLDRIILISDAVRGTSDQDTLEITDEFGVLMGGAYTLNQSVNRLRGLGLSEERLTKVISDNPKEYLKC